MPSGGILTISTDLVDKQVVIRISDTGVGIPAELLPKLFEPFVTHGKSHGTGLGMAMAKAVVTAHNGKISVSSVQATAQPSTSVCPRRLRHCSGGHSRRSNCELRIAICDLRIDSARLPFNRRSANEKQKSDYPVV